MTTTILHFKKCIVFFYLTGFLLNILHFAFLFCISCYISHPTLLYKLVFYWLWRRGLQLIQWNSLLMKLMCLCLIISQAHSLNIFLQEAGHRMWQSWPFKILVLLNFASRVDWRNIKWSVLLKDALCHWVSNRWLTTKPHIFTAFYRKFKM